MHSNQDFVFSGFPVYVRFILQEVGKLLVSRIWGHSVRFFWGGCDMKPRETCNWLAQKGMILPGDWNSALSHSHGLVMALYECDTSVSHTPFME